MKIESKSCIDLYFKRQTLPNNYYNIVSLGEDFMQYFDHLIYDKHSITITQLIGKDNPCKYKDILDLVMCIIESVDSICRDGTDTPIKP